MNAASACFFLCYIPELYANYHNKNANLYNVPEKVIMLLGTGLAFSYAAVNNDESLMINYGPILGLDIIAFGMRAYYAWNSALPRKIDDSDTKENSDDEFVKA